MGRINRFRQPENLNKTAFSTSCPPYADCIIQKTVALLQQKSFKNLFVLPETLFL
ncbi:MAG: hypothetical protein IKZ88_07700 [Neisseriaceae bacterium]|nr:hypothetical protein [Neisseriaceae bacterium]